MKVYSLVEGHGEDECPRELAARVGRWAKEVAVGTPVGVVIAYREYETWFLAALESLRGRYGISECAEPPTNSEQKRDAKSVLEQYMPPRRAYSETGDQPGMSAVFGLGLAYRRNRSFRKLVKTIGDLLRELRQPVPLHWPPQEWDVAS